MNRTFRPLLLLRLGLTVALAAVSTDALALLADAGHRPFNADVPKANGDPLPRRQYREPYVEISNTTTVTVYQVLKKFNNGQLIANQTGGTLYVKGASQQQWTQIGGPANYQFHANEGDFQYWKASFTPAALGIAPTEVIQYYFYLTFDFGAENTYVYAGQGKGDLSSQVTNSESTAASNAFSIRNRPGWIFHANNRVVNGNDVQFWAKVGYISDPNNLNTRWATNGAIYYTIDGSEPSGSLGSGSGSTAAIAFSYSHPESNNQGAPSIAGTAMWWQANVSNLLGVAPFGSTVKYKLGFWNSQNNEEKFAEHNAGTNNTTFAFQNGVFGDPALSVNGLNANYTTSHVFIDETVGGSANFTINFSPGQPNITAAEVFTNLNRRNRAEVDADGDGTEDGIHPPNGNNLVAGDDSQYYKAYTMTANGPGSYTLTLPANKTGAYRLTARWKVSGDNNWRWYTGFGRRDHAIVVSPTAARDINLYEINVLNVEANGDTFATRSTFEDLFDAPNAPHQGSENRWNLPYLKNLGANWLWFQPIHPVTLEAQQGFDPGSPYSVRNFFEINPLMSVGYNPNATSFSGNPINPTVHPDNRNAARLAFKGFVAAADIEGVGVMLDAPFNHTAPDAELSIYGVNYIAPGNGTVSLIRDTEARFYSRDGDYGQRASSAANIAIAPDRGDFGKWGDVRDVFFGNYSALVTTNPDTNGNYNNESDIFDYTSPNWTSDDRGDIAGFQNVTRGVWKYFAEYTLHWLNETGVPPGADLATQTAKGIDGLRADFGQGLPPQFWEYAINKTRTRKWNFVFMAESLDGGAVTYRSNRHFDILNENIVFPLKSASNAGDYRGIFEGRRGAYGQGLVLLNNMSHDEESYEDPWQAVVRYGVVSTVDGVPLIFPGQELGISRTFGYSQYETNFGKQIAHFKRYNSMLPAWLDSNFGNDQLYPVYQGIGQARLFSRALRSSNRYFLSEDGSNQTIFGVAKFETLNGLPGNSDVVFAFGNTNRDASPAGNFHVNQDVDGNGQNDYGIQASRTYNIRNIAAYTKFDPNRRSYWLWGNGRTGADVLNNGVFVLMNRVPTDDASWQTVPFEPQYLKLYDVTAPSTSPGTPTTANGFNYSIGSNSVLVSWNPAPPDAGGVQPQYRVTYSYNGGPAQSFITSATSFTFGGSAGQTLTVTITAVNPNDNSVAGPSTTVTIRFLVPGDDDDRDGISNEGEDAAGTNPLDATSAFRVVRVANAPSGQITLEWTSVPGKTYRIEGASEVYGTYMPLGSQVAASPGLTTEATVPATGKKFFRVSTVP